jgi:outer membrane protein TolC
MFGGRLLRFLCSRPWASLLGAAALLAGGCAQWATRETREIPLIVRAVPPGPVEHLPPPRPANGALLGTPHSDVPKFLPISLDTVFRLAQDQNGQINIAREKLQEAFANKDLADKRWLPDLWTGVTFYRHEGGIQNEDGRLLHSSYGALFAGVELRGRFDVRDAAYQKIEAERKIWQQRGELSRLTSENLLDAANTYVDLLAARQGEAFASELKKKLRDLHANAAKLAGTEEGARVEVVRIQAESDAQEQIARKLREGANAAAAKLIYLLGLDPTSELVPVDRQLLPFVLVDASTPIGVLVDQALVNGPGIREMEGLLAMIEEARAKAHGPGRLLPVFEVNVAEGAFGAGPGSHSNWDNRLDLLLQARWNLTEFATARERQRLVQSKQNQAQLSYQDLRAKLHLGVQEAREASLSAAEQIQFGQGAVKNAAEAYELSKKRLELAVKGYSHSEVLMAIRALGAAQLGYLYAIRDHDKAQIRLLVLTGAVGGEPAFPHDSACPAQPILGPPRSY